MSKRTLIFAFIGLIAIAAAYLSFKADKQEPEEEPEEEIIEAEEPEKNETETLTPEPNEPIQKESGSETGK